MEKITKWSTVDENGINKKHNHIEDGWIIGDYPKPIDSSFTNQEAWKKMNWIYEHGYLLDGKVVKFI